MPRPGQPQGIPLRGVTHSVAEWSTRAASLEREAADARWRAANPTPEPPRARPTVRVVNLARAKSEPSKSTSQTPPAALLKPEAAPSPARPKSPRIPRLGGEPAPAPVNPSHQGGRGARNPRARLKAELARDTDLLDDRDLRLIQEVLRERKNR